MPAPLLEIIVQTVADAREAARGGADRLEVVRDLGSGGLTPRLELVAAIAAETGLPLRVMVRENAGFLTDAGELPRLRRAAEDFTALGVDGLVLGFARDGGPALDEVRKVIDAVPEARVTFHRAFDTLPAPVAGLDEIAALPAIDRVLTGGGDGTARQRCDRLEAWARHAHDRLTIVAGGGIDDDCLRLLAASPVVREVHLGRLARERSGRDAPVSAGRVRRARDILYNEGLPGTITD